MAQLPPDLPTSLLKRGGSSILTHAALICCCDISNRRESSSGNLSVAFLLITAILLRRWIISVLGPGDFDFFFFVKSLLITGQKHADPQRLSELDLWRGVA